MIDVPLAIAAYFGADPAADIEALSAVFTADAHVHDEKHDHTGIEAIRHWRVDTFARTPFTARLLDMDKRDGKFVVAVEVSGAFPGSPITLDHSFTLVDGRIASLDIR